MESEAGEPTTTRNRLHARPVVLLPVGQWKEASTASASAGVPGQRAGSRSSRSSQTVPLRPGPQATDKEASYNRP